MKLCDNAWVGCENTPDSPERPRSASDIVDQIDDAADQVWQEYEHGPDLG